MTFEVVGNELTLALTDTVERVSIQVTTAEGVPVDPSQLSVRITDLGGNTIYTDNFFGPPARIVKTATGAFYFPLGDQSIVANTETTLARDLLVIWHVEVGSDADNLVQSVKVVTPYVLDLVGSLRRQIDKAAKQVVDDPENPCYLGYTDKALVEYLEGGLQVWNMYEPYPTFCTLDAFPRLYKQGLVEAALIVGIQSQELFAIDMDVPNYCFVEGTSVTLASGERRPIESIRVGDIVLDRTGHAQRVEAAWDEGVPKEVVRLTLWGGRVIEATEQHRWPVWAWPRTCGCGCDEPVKPGRQYVLGHHTRVANANRDETLPPTVAVHGTRRIPVDYEPHQTLRTGEIRRDDFLMIPRKFAPVRTDVTEDEARLLGYYASQGSMTDKESGTPSNLAWVFHADAPWVQDIEALASKLGFSLAVRPNPNAHALDLRTRNDRGRSEVVRRLVQLACEHVGEYATKKTLSETLMRWPVRLKWEFIRGLLRGDGCQNWMIQTKNGETARSFNVSLSTSSPFLATQVELLLAQLGFPVRASVDAGGTYNIRGKTGPKAPNWRLVVPMPYAAELARRVWGERSKAEDFPYGNGRQRPPRPVAMVDDDYVYVPVQKVARVRNRKRVYNLTVAGDHSYLAEGIGTFNSAQGAAFTIQHQPQLAQFATRLAQRLDKLIPIAKLKFVRSGSLHTEIAPNSRIQALVSAAPNGALFRNFWARS